ncbi:MAG: glycosyltransferase family 4 protein [Clostridia bacterium]|nr:glycosyltransferase family 4 protein [Clostridia bacterium]
MVILHVARTRNNLVSGADVVVPEHIREHQKVESVALLNVEKTIISGIDNQFEYSEDFKLSGLKEPFNKPDIIVFHQVYFPKFLKIAKEARKLNIPYIIIPHGSMTKEAQRAKRLKKIVGNLLYFNKFMNGAASIQYLSEDEKNRAFKKFPCFVSTNGLNMPNEQKESFNEDKLVFSYIGRYDTHIKGLDLLIEAVKQKEDFLRKNNCVVNLYGPQHLDLYVKNVESLKSAIKEKTISDIVFINGPVIAEEKKNTLLKTDVFIQCSRSEAMGLSIAEALSYGVPSIVTYTTTMGDFIDKYDAGWSCQTTAEDIANSIEKAVLEKHLLKEKSKNAITLVKSEFLWENVAKDALENYRKFI